MLRAVENKILLVTLFVPVIEPRVTICRFRLVKNNELKPPFVQQNGLLRRVGKGLRGLQRDCEGLVEGLRRFGRGAARDWLRGGEIAICVTGKGILGAGHTPKEA